MLTEIQIKLPKYKTHWREICAILPVYLPDGTNGTEISYLDGTKDYIPKRLCWVLDDLLFHLRSSTGILTRQSRTMLGRNARRVPLVLKTEFSLVPVKGRQKIGEYDSATGYIVLHHAEKIMHADGRTQVQFTGGTSVQVYDNPRTLADKIRTAENLLTQMDVEDKTS